MFVALYCILTVAMVSGTIPSLTAGVLFGPVFGTVLTLVGAVLGAAAAFELAGQLDRRPRVRRFSRLVGGSVAAGPGVGSPETRRSAVPAATVTPA